MIDKIIQKLTDIGFEYKNTYGVHSGTVIYIPTYLDNSHYRFTIITDKDNIHSRNVSIVLVNDINTNTKAKATVLFSKKFFLDSTININNLTSIYSIIDEKFKNEIRDFKLNKLLYT